MRWWELSAPDRQVVVLRYKANGKLRPLGIPTIKDRAMQALYLLALEPVAETTGDPIARRSSLLYEVRMV